MHYEPGKEVNKMVSYVPLTKINLDVFLGQLSSNRILCEILSFNIKK